MIVLVVIGLYFLLSFMWKIHRIKKNKEWCEDKYDGGKQLILSVKNCFTGEMEPKIIRRRNEKWTFW